LSTKYDFVHQLPGKKHFLAGKSPGKEKGAVNKYMLCRTKCATKHILAGKGSGKNMRLSDKMFNKAYICCQMFLLGGGQLFSYTMLQQDL